MTPLAASLALALLAGTAGAAAAADERAERERIARERAAVQSRYAQQEQACRGQFAVTACVDRARAERREAMDHLTEQERVLDEAQRKRRAAERLARIEQRTHAPPSAREQQRRLQFEQRRREAEERRQRAEQRNAERRKPRAAPLPDPAASAVKP